MRSLVAAAAPFLKRAGGKCRLPIRYVCLGLLFLFLVLAAAGRARAQETLFPDWRFGVIESYEAPDEADALGAAWTRITFQWADIQTGGPHDWTPIVSDAQIAAEAERGRLIVGLLIGVPQWARGEDGLPRGLELPADHPENLWADFVRRAVSRYKGEIDHWVVWNEPDVCDEAARRHTWEGTVAEFARLEEVTYVVAKGANPDAVVHLPAFTYYWDANYGREQTFTRLLDVLSADPQAEANNHYFDVATAHVYFQPTAIYDVITIFRQALAQHGLQKPLWLVETNAPPSQDPAWPVSDATLEVSLNEQAAYVPQALATALAAGAERVAVYKLKDLNSDVGANPEPFGLLRMDGSRRPAFTTYQIAAQYLAGAHNAQRRRWDEVGHIHVDQGQVTTSVLFSRLPVAQQVQVQATSDTALLVDMWGNRRMLTAADGTFSLTLPPALCTQSIGDHCMIGGTTYYLIQAKAGQELPRQWPAPSLSPTNPPPPTVAPTMTPEPVPPATKTAVPLNGVFESNEASVSFPDTVTFRLALAPGREVASARLNYGVVRRSCVDVSTQVPVEVTGTTLEWQWIMSRSGNPPPGATVWWEWTLQAPDGRITATPRQRLTLTDDRFSWRTVRSDGVALNWYEGQDAGPVLLDAAEEGLERLETQMGIRLQEDASFYIYGDAADMRQAVLYVQDWAGGVAFTEYNTILIGVRPERVQGWGQETVRHELAHLVLGQFGHSCLGGSRPTWLEEGFAVYAQGPPDEETLRDIERGIEEDAFVPLRSLSGSFPAHGGEASIAYSQSYSVVNFLLEEYGAEQLQKVILTLAQGKGTDQALEEVYGFNVDGLEVAWRRAIGAPPRAIPPTPTAISAGAIPTVAPLSVEETVPTPPAAAATPVGSSQPTLPLCGLGWAPLLLLGALGAILSRRSNFRIS
jgi:hypothetical protein